MTVNLPNNTGYDTNRDQSCHSKVQVRISRSEGPDVTMARDTFDVIHGIKFCEN